MDSLISLYKQRLNLPKAQFSFIVHEDDMVGQVFKISQPGSPSQAVLMECVPSDLLRACSESF